MLKEHVFPTWKEHASASQEHVGRFVTSQRVTVGLLGAICGESYVTVETVVLGGLRSNHQINFAVEHLKQRQHLID